MSRLNSEMHVTDLNSVTVFLRICGHEHRPLHYLPSSRFGSSPDTRPHRKAVRAHALRSTFRMPPARNQEKQSEQQNWAEHLDRLDPIRLGATIRSQFSRHSSLGGGLFLLGLPARLRKGPGATSGLRWLIWRCGWGDGFVLLDQSAVFSIKLSILFARLVTISRAVASLNSGRACGSRVASKICRHTVLIRSGKWGQCANIDKIALFPTLLACHGACASNFPALFTT